MTIAAGFRVRDGVLLCADSEHTDDISKFRKTKIRQEGNNAIITGAGDSHLLSVASDEILKALRESMPNDEDQARLVIQDIVQEIHREHIFAFYTPESQLRPRIELLVTCRCADGNLALIKTKESTATLVGAYESVGIGKSIFEYWASLLFTREYSAEAAAYLLLFVIREVKTNVSGCGGETHIRFLPKTADQNIINESIPENVMLVDFPVSFAQILVDCIDEPQSSDTELEWRFSNLLIRVKQLRDQFRIKYQAARPDRQSTTIDPLPPPPSPE